MEVVLKKQLLSIAVTFTMIIPMSIIGFAGLSNRVNANIPFDFTVGGQEFKAGRYFVDPIFSHNPDCGLILRSADRRMAANFLVNNISERGAARARMVFRRYGNQYFLAQIFDGQSEQGAEFIKSKAEREAAKNRNIITQNTVEPETVIVVAQIGR
jgi:hypothetical protein